ASAVERHTRGGEPPQGVGKRGASRIKDCRVIKAGRTRRRRRAAAAFPGVQPDMVMIAAGRDEGRARHPLSQFEPEHADIKGKRTFNIRHFQMYVADADARIDWRRRPGRGFIASGDDLAHGPYLAKE